MKKTKKHNIKNISFLALTFSALCLAGCNAVKSSNSNVVEEMPKAYIMQQKAVMPKKAYGDTINLLNQNYDLEHWIACYEDLAGDTLENITSNPEETYTVSGNVEMNNGTGEITTIQLIYQQRMEDVAIKEWSIRFVTTLSGYPYYRISQRGTNALTGNMIAGGASSSIVSATLTEYTEQVYYAITQETPPAPSMGEQIVDGIESGLGMIGTLASEFLAGFGALFYVNNQLTPFAIFSLVFLGIAITFAIIKLCLNVVRSNTGA